MLKCRRSAPRPRGFSLQLNRQAFENVPMQDSFHRPLQGSGQGRRHRKSGRLAAGLILFAVLKSPAPLLADPFATPWSGADSAKARLIAAPADGFVRAGVAIALAPDALTYWREPGEAGVPPVFSFEGSRNVAAAEVLYPAPKRIDEAGTEAFGYRGGVVFPIHVRPRDPMAPMTLALTLDYAVCTRICLPVKFKTELILPLSGTSPFAPELAAAEAQVPQVLASADIAGKIKLEAGQDARWTLVWMEPTPVTDLFAEAPEGWYFTTKKIGDNRFAIGETEHPAGAAAADLRLTLTAPTQNVSFTLHLDPSATP